MSVSYTSSVSSIVPAVLSSELGLCWPSCWAPLAGMLGYASAVSLSPFRCAFAAGESIPWIRVRGCDYSRVTRVRVLLTFLITSLRYLRILASLGVTWCDTPSFLAYPHVFLTCGPFIGFLGFFGVRQSYSCVGVDRQDDYSANSSASLAQ